MDIDNIIRARKTVKVRPHWTEPFPAEQDPDFDKVVDEMLATAGWAPFHYPSNPAHQKEKALGGIEPWRFYVLDNVACRKLLNGFVRDEPVKASDNVKKMLAAARSLVIATWLPDPTELDTGSLFMASMRNMEHIAATAAAIQNLTLAATGRGIPSYWSSGGAIRMPVVRALLGIPADEIVLGTVFLFPDRLPEGVEVAPGKNREKRSAPENWMRRVVL